MPISIRDVAIGDLVTLAKPHACGTNLWHVVRIGADVGLVCAHCRQRVMLTLGAFERRARTRTSGEQ